MLANNLLHAHTNGQKELKSCCSLVWAGNFKFARVERRDFPSWCGYSGLAGKYWKNDIRWEDHASMPCKLDCLCPHYPPLSNSRVLRPSALEVSRPWLEEQRHPPLAYPVSIQRKRLEISCLCNGGAEFKYNSPGTHPVLGLDSQLWQVEI